MNMTSLKLAGLAGALLALPASAANLSAYDWEIGPIVRGRNYSEGMPLAPRPGPGGSLVFDFPLAGSGQVDAMTTRVRPLAGARAIKVRYRVVAPRGARFVADESPDEPATFSLYFQQTGDNWSARGRFESYRWYSPARAVVPLAAGERTLTVRFDEAWVNVGYKPNTDQPERFAMAMERTANFGLAFGSATLRSHGVYATAPARFELLGFDIIR